MSEMLPETLPDWPLFGLGDDARPALQAARGAGKPCALATIVALDGGGPRPVGTQMVIGEGLLSGFLSGGCLEADVVGHAQAVLADGEPRRLVYGTGSPWPDIRLLCGARIELLVERIAPDDAAVGRLLALRDAREPAVWITDGRRRACAPPGQAPRAWEGAFERAFEPIPRLVVLGGDPTALAIAQLGALAGFETTLVRPKGPETPPPFDVAYSRDEPADALAAIGLDRWTAVAVATHEAEADHAALTAALPSQAFYVGALGARRRAADRLAWLRASGVGEGDIARLKTPIGLAIGGKAPWEVAISVLGEITQVRYARSSSSASTSPPAASAGAPGARRTRASAMANTETSDES
ncbi:MAG TPA: XdhC family protein [Caulobacteraceae bacterium]|nr:XdhC family protein [Caulobacteraceae bacterium]